MNCRSLASGSMTLGDLDRTWLRRAVAAGLLFILLLLVTFIGLVVGVRPLFQTTSVLATVV